MEGNSYLDELTGKPKEKESIWQLLMGIPKVLRSNYGQVVVNFGEPIKLGDVLAQHAPDWDGKPVAEDEKPKWLADTVDTLAERISVNINRAADVNPINLLALALLSTPKHAMGEADLLAQIALSQKLLAQAAVFRSRHGDAAHARADHRPRRRNQRARAHPASARRRARRRRRQRGAAELLPQQRAAPVHRGGVDRLLLPAQPPHEPVAAAGLGRRVYPFLQAELFLPWTRSGVRGTPDAHRRCLRRAKACWNA